MRNFLEKRRNRITGKVGRPGRPVVCLETGHQWPSVKSAAGALGVTMGAMSYGCQGKYKIKGLTYRYKSDLEDGGGPTEAAL